MKKFIFWIGILLLVTSCTMHKQVVKTEPSAAKTIAEKKAQTVAIEQNDTAKYEVNILDPHFQSWYATHNIQSQYRPLSYYEFWNRRYVEAWNIKAMNPIRYPFFQVIVGYDPTADYGFELNHKLFYYFMYVEHELKIPILSGGGPQSY